MSSINLQPLQGDSHMVYHGSMEPSLTHLDLKAAELYNLVLASQGMAVEVEKQEDYFNLVVAEELEAKALGIIELFLLENLTPAITFRKVVPRKVSGPLCAALVLLFIHLGVSFMGKERELVLEYGSSALYILQGEFYRVATALFLHADLEHLLGNIVGILIFGIPVSTRTGTWPGLLMLLIAGMAGNFATAYLYRTAHLSIGASTSVMGAAGILTFFQVVDKALSWGMDFKIFLPLGAGAALLGMLSSGEDTDIMAHFMGFVSGMVLGAFVSIFQGRREFSMVQKLLACFILFLMLGLSFFKGLGF